MMKELRAQVQRELYAVPAQRKPALRRSDLHNALLATDLPLIAPDEAVQDFAARMAAIGWRCWLHNGWLALDAPIPAPDADVPQVLTGEAGCCISLLLRHQDNGPAQDWIRAVVKAADAGKMPFERLCGELHSALAAMLRVHQPLPGELLPWLCKACHMLYK